MKKHLLLLVFLFLTLLSLSASRELLTFATSFGYDGKAKAVEPGFYCSYLLGVEVNNRFSIGAGTYVTSSFAINSNIWSNSTSFLFGPAFTASLSGEVTLSSISGVEAILLSNRRDDIFGIGIGTSLSFNFTPKAEQNTRVQLGLMAGTKLSYSFLEDETTALSGHVFIGFVISQPFTPRLYYYPAYVYDRVIDYYLHY